MVSLRGQVLYFRSTKEEREGEKESDREQEKESWEEM